MVKVYTRGLRVQALLSGSNSPTSWCPEAVDWIMRVILQGVRTLVPEEGVAYIEFARTSTVLHYKGVNVHKVVVLLITLALGAINGLKDYGVNVCRCTLTES